MWIWYHNNIQLQLPFKHCLYWYCIDLKLHIAGSSKVNLQLSLPIRAASWLCAVCFLQYDDIGLLLKWWKTFLFFMWLWRPLPLSDNISMLLSIFSCFQLLSSICCPLVYSWLAFSCLDLAISMFLGFCGWLLKSTITSNAMNDSNGSQTNIYSFISI